VSRSDLWKAAVKQSPGGGWDSSDAGAIASGSPDVDSGPHMRQVPNDPCDAGIAVGTANSVDSPVPLQLEPLLPDDEPVSFNIQQMVFTIPLPDEDTFDGPIRAAIEMSTNNLRAGKLEAARDACFHALTLDQTHLPTFLRLAEINAALGASRQARAQAEGIVRSLRATGDEFWSWRAYRLLVHVSEDPLQALRTMVDLRLRTGELDDATSYAVSLIRLLSERGALKDALDYSARICETDPANTGAALEHTVLLVKNGKANQAIDRWEQAAAAGADSWVGRSALAAIMTLVSEAEHWNMLAEVADHVGQSGDTGPVRGYLRIAQAMEPSAVLRTGVGVLLARTEPNRAIPWLQSDASIPDETPETEAIRLVALSRVLTGQRENEARAAALRAAIQSLDGLVPEFAPPWQELVGFTPTPAMLTAELAATVKDQGDVESAIDILQHAQQRYPGDAVLGQQLADLYHQSGKVGAALSVLDALASSLKDQGKLKDMAAVLRQMSQLVPNNIKVKTRLIESFLQRGFVSEARAELLHRADLQQRAGSLDDARESLERAASLGWSLGLQEEAFAIYQRILDSDPDTVGPRHSLVALYLQAGRVEDAIRQQRLIVDISLRANRRHEAIAALHQIIGLKADDTDAYYQLGDLLAGLGEYGQAERVYRRLMDLQPGQAVPAAKAEAMAALREEATNR
jgi:tetratricopeptide (TPR) repeat protein